MAAGVGMILNEHHLTISHASTASNGANARQVQFGPFDRDIRVKKVYWSPTSANQATHGTATTSATYRRIELFNGGTAGTVSTSASRIASLNITASLAQYGTRAFTTVDTTLTVASGAVMYFSQSTVGGTDDDGTALAAGNISVTYETI